MSSKKTKTKVKSSIHKKKKGDDQELDLLELAKWVLREELKEELEKVNKRHHDVFAATLSAPTKKKASTGKKQQKSTAAIASLPSLSPQVYDEQEQQIKEEFF